MDEETVEQRLKRLVGEAADIKRRADNMSKLLQRGLKTLETHQATISELSSKTAANREEIENVLSSLSQETLESPADSPLVGKRKPRKSPRA